MLKYNYFQGNSIFEIHLIIGFKETTPQKGYI